jgi:hypothetical protein
MRPYNFDGLPEGHYFIQIEDEFGKQVERVKYTAGKIEKFVHVIKLAGEEGKYMLSGISKSEDTIHVRIYDASYQLLFEESRLVTGEFGQVYNLKYLTGSFTIEVSDSNGILNSTNY